MSNVILGIMGVILFIGLALAGTVWIGPEFMSASADTQASRMAASTQQVVFAMRAYKIKEGTAYASYSPNGLVPTYLKSVPLNIDGSPSGYNQIDMTGTLAAPGNFIVTGIAADPTKATAVCRSLAEYTGQAVPASGPPTITAMSQLVTPTGCFTPSTSFGSLVAGNVYAYGRL